MSVFSKEILELANKMFNASDDVYPEKTKTAFIEKLQKAWLTRQYFSKGKHDLVLPAWLLGILGPNGQGRHGIAGLPILHNTDLRNYIALGSPDSEEEPVVDHKGGIIPIPGSFTIIFGTSVDDRPYYSSEIGEVNLEINEDGFPLVTVEWEVDGDTMVYDLYSDRDDEGNEALAINVVRGFANHPLYVTLCPMDQDGLTEVKSIEYDNKAHIVHPKNLPAIDISEEPIRVVTLATRDGHAGRQITNPKLASNSATCEAQAASWAAAFPVRASPTFTIVLDGRLIIDFPDSDDIEEKWEEVVDDLPEISTSDPEVDFLFVTSAITLRLLSDVEKSVVTLGPSVQEEIWLPSLVFQTIALDRLGFSEKVVRPILNNVITFIDTNGLATKNNQWDAQGSLILAFAFHAFISKDWNWLGEKYSILKRIADWVVRQRKRQDHEIELNPNVLGLLGKGTPSWFDSIYWKMDYYFCHNFWGAGLLFILSKLAIQLGKHGDSEKYLAELEKYKQNLDDSITQSSTSLSFLPAGPNQRDNAEMIFNLHAFYPLKLYLPGFQPLVNTVDWLWENYCDDGGLLIDQPFNAFATYHSILIAQSFRYIEKFEPVIDVVEFMKNNTTNKTGWAEAISPLSNMGAVGDSPNGYAAAEWVNLILDLFVEQYLGEAPILFRGMPISWLKKGVRANNLRLRDSSRMTLEAKIEKNDFIITWDWDIEDQESELLVQLPKPAKKTPSNVEQISTLVYSLQKNKGKIVFQLEN